MVSRYLSNATLRQNTDGVLQIHTKNQTKFDKHAPHNTGTRFSTVRHSSKKGTQAL